MKALLCYIFGHRYRLFWNGETYFYGCKRCPFVSKGPIMRRFGLGPLLKSVVTESADRQRE
jgi:hypothetical protein